MLFLVLFILFFFNFMLYLVLFILFFSNFILFLVLFILFFSNFMFNLILLEQQRHFGSLPVASQSQRDTNSTRERNLTSPKKMINAEQKLRLGIVILIISILVVLALTSSGASMIARANSYLDANDIGYQTGNDEDPDAENDDDADTSTSTTSAEGGDTGSTTASSSGTSSSEKTYDPNLRARPTTENVVRPTDDNIWGGMKLDSMPQDKDISGGPTVNGALTANVGEFMGVRSKGAEPFFPDREFGWYINEGQVSIDRANAKTFRINIFCASYKDNKFPIPTDEFKAAYLNFWKVAGAGFITPEWGKLDVFEFDSNHPADHHYHSRS